jgi:DNA mismatch endonuclease (patch repair protein)
MPKEIKRGRDPAITSRMMSKVKSKNTKAELLVRQRLHARGFRYRVHYNKVYGRPDIVFTRQRIAIFIDGDFWHGNSWRLRGLSSLAEQFPNRTDWWVAKLERTMRRDAEVTRTLEADGWTVLRIWESDIEKNADLAVEFIIEELENRR